MRKKLLIPMFSFLSATAYSMECSDDNWVEDCVMEVPGGTPYPYEVPYTDNPDTGGVYAPVDQGSSSETGTGTMNSATNETCENYLKEGGVLTFSVKSQYSTGVYAYNTYSSLKTPGACQNSSVSISGSTFDPRNTVPYTTSVPSGTIWVCSLWQDYEAYEYDGVLYYDHCAVNCKEK